MATKNPKTGKRKEKHKEPAHKRREKKDNDGGDADLLRAINAGIRGMTADLRRKIAIRDSCERLDRVGYGRGNTDALALDDRTLVFLLKHYRCILCVPIKSGRLTLDCVSPEVHRDSLLSPDRMEENVRRYNQEKTGQTVGKVRRPR